jgi:putative oxidoreductase
MPDMTPPKALIVMRDLISAIVSRLKWLPPLAARLTLGVVFIETGWGKLHDLAGTAENFADWHIPFPHFNAVLASCTEFFGGCLILLGLCTRLAAVPLIVVMAVAIATAKWPRLEGWTDFFGFDELAYAVMFLWLAIAGAGRVSLDALLGRRLGLAVDEKAREEVLNR